MDSKNTDQKLKLLQFQNQNLSAQLETQRKELNNLQEKISGYEGKQDDYAQSLLCVNRLWEQLNQDILFLSTRATGEAAALAPSALAPEQPTESNGTGSISDPYLQQLLKVKVSTAPGSEDLVTDKHASVQSQLTATERLLVARSTQTKATLANLLASIQQQKEHSDALAAALQSSSADDALKAELLALRGAKTNLAVELDATVARCRVAEEELQQQKDRHVEILHKLQKLQNELADKEEESTIIQKKYYALKMTGVDQLQPSSSQAEGSRAASAAAAAAAAQLPAGGSAEAQELRELLNKRGAELQKEREVALQLQRCGAGQPPPLAARSSVGYGGSRPLLTPHVGCTLHEVGREREAWA
jgi:E3 ubiquitin-protein ligase BRE1